MFFVVGVVFPRYSSVFRSIQCQKVLKHCKHSELVQVTLILPTEGQPMEIVTSSSRHGTGATLAQRKFQKVGMKISKFSGLWITVFITQSIPNTFPLGMPWENNQGCNHKGQGYNHKRLLLILQKAWTIFGSSSPVLLLLHKH